MSAKIDALFKVNQEINHAETLNSTKIKSLVECNITCIDAFLKMKSGPLTTIKLALDSDKTGDCIFSFRLLTSAEEYKILEEMATSNLSPLDIRYSILYTALTLSKASAPYPSLKDFTIDFNSPELKKEDLLFLPKNMLLALGIEYKKFTDKYSPKLEALTQEQIDECIQAIQECEDDIKKFDLLNTWNWNVIPEVLIASVKKLSSLAKQMEAVFIG